MPLCVGPVPRDLLADGPAPGARLSCKRATSPGASASGRPIHAALTDGRPTRVGPLGAEVVDVRKALRWPKAQIADEQPAPPAADQLGDALVLGVLEAGRQAALRA